MKHTLHIGSLLRLPLAHGVYRQELAVVVGMRENTGQDDDLLCSERYTSLHDKVITLRRCMAAVHGQSTVWRVWESTVDSMIASGNWVLLA